VQELRAMLEEAQRQLQEVGAQLAKVVGQRDAVTAQAEAAARDATNLLQLMARRAETQPSSQVQVAAAGAEAGIETVSADSQPSQPHQLAEATTTPAADSTGPSAADVERLEQRLKVFLCSVMACQKPQHPSRTSYTDRQVLPHLGPFPRLAATLPVYVLTWLLMV